MNNLALFFLTILCWAPAWYIIKFQLGYVDPLISVFYRFLLASLLIFSYLIFKKKNLKFSVNHHIWFFIFGTCIYSINYIFFYIANIYVISAFPAVIYSASIIMTIIGEWLIFKRKPTHKTLIGASIGMLGIIIIFNDEIFYFTLDNRAHLGLFFAFVGTLAASAGNVIHQRNTNNNFPLIQSIAYASFYGAIITLLFSKINHTPILFEYSFRYIVSLIYLSIFSTIFAFIFFLKLIDKVGSGRSAYVSVVMPPIALLISTYFENLEWQLDLIIGLPFLLIGAILVINQKIKPIS